MAIKFPIPRELLVTIVLAVFLANLGLCLADPVVDEPFDSPTPTWSVRKASNVRLLAQLRTQSPNANHPKTAERVVLTCPAGYAAHIEHNVGVLPVLDELNIEVVVRANRPGLQLAAEVVYPRSLDPVTGEPRRTLVHGMRYAEPGSWQRLKLDNVPLLATRQARLMSAAPGQQVDSREAFVGSVVLVVPGGSNESLVEVDQLTVEGVATQPAVRAEATPVDGLASGPALEGPQLHAPGLGAGQQRETFEPVEVRRRGDTLSVAGVPLVPRVLQYRNEPFEFVAELGFNAVWLTKQPTEAQLRAARAARLWVICPPPPAETLAKISPDSIWQTVIAWSMGLDRNALALDALASTVEELRRADPISRPIVIGANDRPRRFGQLADVLVRGATITKDGNAAHSSQSALPLLGCSPWSQISLGWSPAAVQQAKLLVPRASHLGWHSPSGIRHAVLQAMASGTRGVVIRTPERLGRTSPELRRLVDQIQLLNLELSLIEPWLVTGKRLQGAELIGAQANITAWQLGQSRLVYVPRHRWSATSEKQAAMLSVAGVPETAKAHLLSPAGLLPLRGNQVAGGYQVQLGNVAAGALVLFTEDARALAQVQQRIGKKAPQAAQTERGLAVAELSEFESIHSALLNPRDIGQGGRLATLKRGIQHCDQLLAARNYSKARHLAHQIRYDVGSEASRLQQQFNGLGFASLPTQHELRLLPVHQALEESLRRLPRGVNLLAGGDFEDLLSTKSAGWVHASYADSHMNTSVEFTAAQPFHGRSCLRLSAQPTGLQVMTENGNAKPVVWITSPEVQAPAGSVIEITGSVRVATQVGSDVGELLVVDNLGGDELSIRIPATTGWQPFRMVRTVDDSGQLQLNFALTGPASADVDAVMIREIRRPTRSAQATSQTR